MLHSSDVVTATVENHVAKIVVTRESALNSLNLEVLTELERIIQKLGKPSHADPIRAATITGQGKKAFVAGADIKTMYGAKLADVRKFIELGQSVMRGLEELPLPVIAVVNGFAIGGGLELALACDLIVASKSAKLGLAETGLGLIPGFGGTQRLALRAGVGAAKRLIFTADPIGADEALHLGIVDWVVAAEELEQRAAELCAGIIQRGPLALAAAKRAIESGVRASKSEGLSQEVEEFLKVIATADADEGLGAFVEKRKAVFRGS